MNSKVRKAMAEAEAAVDRLPPFVESGAKLVDAEWLKVYALFKGTNADERTRDALREIFFTGAASMTAIMQSNGASPAHAMAAHSAVTRELNEFTDSIKNRGNNNE